MKKGDMAEYERVVNVSPRKGTPPREGAQVDADPGYALIRGRRWRVSDPAIPEPARQALVNELMAARRAVGAARRAAASLSADADADADTSAEARIAAAEARARARVQDAKVALGERGPKWWLERDDDHHRERVVPAARALLRGRAEDATLCPSEIARVIDGEHWRDRMPLVREVVLGRAAEGELAVLQNGRALEMPSAEAPRGPMRVGRGAAFDACHPPRERRR